MGFLRNLEERIEGLVEGVFTRTFKSQVQPVELARKLAKEMEAHKTVSISKTYVPNEYTVYLSEDDHEQITSYERALADELASYLLEHARSERLTLLTRPAIDFNIDERLGLGEFGIQTRLVKPPTEDVVAPQPGELGQTMVYSSLHVSEDEPQAKVSAPVLKRAILEFDGKRFPIDSAQAVVGRSKQCDVVVNDSNISRRHAELTLEDDSWYIADLGSLNGVEVNGCRVEREKLSSGDELVLGTTKIAFDLD